MSRQVPHLIRSRPEIAFYRVKRACQHWELHAFWTRNAQEEVEARARCEQLTTQRCSSCQASMLNSHQERSQ